MKKIVAYISVGLTALENLSQQVSQLVIHIYNQHIYRTISSNYNVSIIVPAILMGPVDVTLEYRDVLTASLTCTAFGGDSAELIFTWISASGITGYNVSSNIEIQNSDNSTTSRITTLPLSLSDRGSRYTCDVAYASNPTEEVEASATLNIGKYYAY